MSIDTVAAVAPDNRLIVAVDPGLVTGWAVWSAPSFQAPQFLSGQIEGRYAFYRTFEATIQTGWSVEVVSEKYDITSQTAKKTRQMDALYINGYLDGLCEKLGIPFELSPRSTKSFSTDDKLKAVEWHRPTPGGHANDAARHLLKYLIGKRPELGGKELLERIAG